MMPVSAIASGLADAEIEKFHARIGLHRGPLGPLDLLEFIDGGCLCRTVSRRSVPRTSPEYSFPA